MNRYIQPHLRQAFVERAVRTNWAVMKMAAGFAVIVETINMMRVVFFAPSRLSTLNNRIYFTFYLILFFLGALFLWIDRFVKSRLSPAAKYKLLLVAGSLFVAWYTIFAIYDINRSVSIGKIGVVTALVFFSALLVMEPLYAVLNIVLSYGVLIVFFTTLNDAGAIFNYCIVGAICLLIYFVRLRDIRTELTQAYEIQTMNQVLEETEEKFLLSKEQYELLLQRGKLIAFKWDMKTDVVRFSHEWKEIFDLPQRIERVEECIQTAKLLQDRQKKELLQCMLNARQKLVYQKVDLLLPVRGGEQHWFEVQIAVQCDTEGQPMLGIGLMFDIMEQKSRVLELQKQLLMDAFTKTLNKTALEKYAVQRLEEMGPGDHMVMLILDMDDFKNINDTYGHLCGDYVLMRLGELMNAFAHGRTRVGRLGGDEFGAIFDMEDAEQEAERYAANLIREVRKIKWGDQTIPVACSVGIAACVGCASYMDLYAAADKALYEAKRLGKDRYCIAEPLVQQPSPKADQAQP